MKFSEGEQVLAKNPNNDNYERAEIVNTRGSKYVVQFKGGMEHTITESSIKPQRTSRSQTRTRGKTGKSPSRSSPSRKSPSRRSPARSPTLNRKLPVRGTRQAKVSLPRLEIPKDNSSDTDRTEGSESLKDEFVEPPIQSRLRELGPITRRSIRIMSNASKAEQEHKLMMLTRSIDRAASLPVERKQNASENKERGLSVQRDEDLMKMMNYEEGTDKASESDGSKSKEIDLVSKPQEWGGWIGALILTLAFPIGIVLLEIACSNDHCSSKNFRIPRFKEWKSFFNLHAFLSYAVYLFFVAILSLVPVGKLVDGQDSKLGRLKYRINGIWLLMLTLVLYAGCEYQGYNIRDFLLKKSLPFSTAGLIYGTVLAIALYTKGGRVPVSNLNIYGSTNNRIYDFWQGREVNPRIGALDIKMTLFRSAIIGTIVINLAAIVKIVRESESLDLNNIHLATVLIAALQIIYCLDSLIFESSFITTFEVSYEGTGFMLSTGYLIYPYLATITTRYLLFNKIQQSIYLLVASAICFLIGFVIYRKSNHIKNEFRTNQFAPSFSKMETIPTKRGKRLLVSGLWGHVRHPNYLGDIIMHWSMACLGLARDILPFILALQVTLLLIHRAKRDNARCQKRYGYAWEQYCSRVKYMIVQWIY